MKTEIFQRSYD